MANETQAHATESFLTGLEIRDDHRVLQIGGVRIDRVLHQGQLSESYLAYHLGLQIPVMLRVMKRAVREKMTQATWDSLMGANLRAPLFLSQAAAPHLKKAGGAIVNITDIHVDRPLKNYVIYSIAKAGLAGLTRSLARELAPDVRVNGVAPGAIIWPEDGSWDDLTRQRIVSHTLLRRTGDPDDVARAVYYLIAEAPYVTGQIIAVDGGRSINI